MGDGHTYHEELIPLWCVILGFDRLFDEAPVHPRLAALMVAGWTMRWLNVSALSCARTWSCPTDSKRAASLRLGTVDLEAWQGPVDLVDPAGLVVPSNQGGPHVGL